MNTTSSGSEDDDPLREARAYNQSIYFMVAMPYLLLGAVSFAVYRGIKAAQKKAEGIEAAREDVADLVSPADTDEETSGLSGG